MSDTEARGARRAPERRPRRRPEESDRPRRREPPPRAERPGRRGGSGDDAEEPQRRRRPEQSAEGRGRPAEEKRPKPSERPTDEESPESPESPDSPDSPESPDSAESPEDEAYGKEEASPRSGSEGDDRDDGARRGSSRPRLGAGEAARRAREELDALIRHAVEGVVAVGRSDDGWIVTLDVVEDPHVPSSSDVLAEYEVRLDEEGQLLGYRRGRRFVRGRVED
ncbi:gas vesicle protein GvpO [Puerhibacterium sp. TATVAM-FAB25]|uniref:gas vesicle protein GvpO n=1 Tax=Puerhibacterium sp. TATVAM-FAB25 TaxID=3093699 RepID=UPI0039793909